MKTIDIKSLIIGALLASTIFLGVAATHNIEGGISLAPIKVEVTLKNGSGLGDAKFDFGK